MSAHETVCAVVASVYWHMYCYAILCNVFILCDTSHAGVYERMCMERGINMVF